MTSNNNVKARAYGSYLDLTDEQSVELKEFWKLVLDRLNDKPVKQKEELSRTGSFSMWKLKEIVVGSSEDLNDIKVSEKTGKELRTSLAKLIRSDHPDVKAIKYLAARNWKAMDSYKMFINSLDFFEEEIHDQVRLEGERSLDINHLNQSEALYYERCNDGRLVLYIWACRGYPSKYTSDENRKAILNLMNNCYLMLGEHPNVTVVFDMNGLTLANTVR
jgi:hypothetical protein